MSTAPRTTELALMGLAVPRPPACGAIVTWRAFSVPHGRSTDTRARVRASPEGAGNEVVDRVAPLIAGAFLLVPATPARASSCSDATDAAQKYVDSYETIRTLEVDQLKRLVKAVCDADEDEQEKVFRDEAERVESMVASEKSNVDKMKADANAKLAAASSDPECTDKGKLSDLQKRVEELSDRIEKIAANGTKAGSNPAFDRLRKLGQLAHDDYYEHHSACAPYRDIEVGSLKPDCILPDGCAVIELKPDNSGAASKGWSAAQESRDRLNTDSGFNALDSKYQQAFAECRGKFKARVDCYHYCPDVDKEGQIASTSLAWYTCKE